jgi:hypothetical protein
MKLASLTHKITGERFIKIDGKGIIPLSVARACVDKRIRFFVIKCSECGTSHPLNHLNEGGYCEDCAFSDFDN